MNKAFSHEAKWVEAPEKLNLQSPYFKAKPLRPVGDHAIEYEIATKNGPLKLQVPTDRAYLMSKGELYDDMCDMDILNEPEVLHNLVERYKRDEIFTFIGPTLLVVNPYRPLPQYFSNEAMLRIQAAILEGAASKQKPHIYLIAGNAYNSMIEQGKKQAIVISGESGAGKTESTKYCMQLLTSLSHKDTHPIEAKILACNPILEAFGNSKTIRNDNSSRFGKYVQIYFSEDNTIVGANINSYLLEKSRVVAPAQKERNFHIFYALVASGIMPCKKVSEYRYLERSRCYQAAGIDDAQYFKEIGSCMDNIGFTEKEQGRIWQLLLSILELGNIEFDDRVHREDESKPCLLESDSKRSMEKIAALLGISEQELQKMLLFEKKVFLKEFTYSPYNKNKCVANVNTLSKAVYNTIFEFLLHKIQRTLRPAQFSHSTSEYVSINILDIFGFENFEWNSLEQFCINFTNEKLLRLYNQYVFEREMQILKEDGLDRHIDSIKPPTNDAIIELMAGKISLLSIINDYTMPMQFKDSDIIAGFQGKLSKSSSLDFDKMNKSKFTIIHSQCSVKYDVEGFKEKNQDKVLPEIATVVNNLFEHSNRDQAGKTLLSKFSKEIDDLIQELTSSSVHFIRCIKPNEKKMPGCPEQKYILTQVRYLGVFETIQIRKKTFPSRWVYEEFVHRFEFMFPIAQGSPKDKTERILKSLTKEAKDFLLGNKRVYMNSELESKLLKKLQEVMKKKVESAKKIWKAYKKYKFKKQIKTRLKKLASRIRLWKKIVIKLQLDLKKNIFNRIKQISTKKIEQEKFRARKLLESKQTREKQQQKLKQQKISRRNSEITSKFARIDSKIKDFYRIFLQRCRRIPSQQSVIDKKSLKSDASVQKIISEPSNQKLNVSDLNETMYVSVGPEDNKYVRNPRGQDQKSRMEGQLNASFVNQQSVLIDKNSSVLFEGTFQVEVFKHSKGLKKLKLILSDRYKPEIGERSEDYLSPPSQDAKFQLEDAPAELMKKIVEFDSKGFYKNILRKRTNFFGMEKDEDDILVVKNKPLSKSLTKLEAEDEKDAIKIFKQILKLAQEPKLDSVYIQVQRVLFLCRKASPELINQVLMQLLKQSNTSNELCSIRTIQALVVFLHVYDPDPDFLIASLNFIFKKLTDGGFSERQAEYFRYTFKKIIRKVETRVDIGFMPIKYQVMALMCKRIISVPIHLPVGGGSHVKVESFENLGDIKRRAMEEFGIDANRLSPDLFTFFELTNFPAGVSEERPLNEKINVWDLISYWQRSTERYAEENESLPTFYLVLKIRYVFQCHQSDEEAIELMFGQTFFDYFMGRIKVDLKGLSRMAACLKKLAYTDSEQEELKNHYPDWALKKYPQKQLTAQLYSSFKTLMQELEETSYSNVESELKFRYLRTAEEAPLTMAIAISTEQQVKLFFRHKMMYMAENNQIVEAIPIKSIVKYADKENEFVFSVRNNPQTKIVYTEHGSICVKYMTLLQELVTRKISTSGSRPS